MLLHAEREGGVEGSYGKAATGPVRAFAEKAESLAWPMKIMKELVDGEEYTEELLRWLSRWDTEYAKFVDPKVQILTALEEQRHPRIRDEVERFERAGVHRSVFWLPATNREEVEEAFDRYAVAAEEYGRAGG